VFATAAASVRNPKLDFQDLRGAAGMVETCIPLSNQRMKNNNNNNNNNIETNSSEFTVISES
jgi:hypothetical protein